MYRSLDVVANDLATGDDIKDTFREVISIYNGFPVYNYFIVAINEILDGVTPIDAITSIFKEEDGSKSCDILLEYLTPRFFKSEFCKQYDYSKNIYTYEEFKLIIENYKNEIISTNISD